MIYKDGRKYVGGYCKGMKCGVGYDIDQNGDKYIGQFSNDKYDG